MKPWKIVIFIIIEFSFSFSANSQDKPDLIKGIRNQYKRINSYSLNMLTLEGKEFMDNIPDGGAELTGYFKDDSLLKISEWIGLSYGNQIREYYFSNNKLFFVFEKFDSFIQTESGVDITKTKNCFQGHYYFANKKLIKKSIRGKKPIEENSKNIANDLQTDASENIKKLVAKRQ